MYKIEVLLNRLNNLGIDIRLGANIPWIYIDCINGVKVTEKFHAEHGFTLCLLPIQNDQYLQFTDIGEIFKLIRKYCE